MSARATSSMSSALLERGYELARIDELLEGAIAGSGHLLLVTGPAGIGKTSLLEACARSAGERGIRALAARRRAGDGVVVRGGP